MTIGIPFTNLNPFSFFVVLGQTKSKLNNIKWQANLGGAGIGKSQSINRTGFCDVITRSCPFEWNSSVAGTETEIASKE